MGAKYTAKDSVFRDLFEQPEYLLQLYQTLHTEDTTATVDDLEIVTIEQILTDGIYNDLGFIVRDRLIVLVEAQSTWSDNIVIRSLIYLMRTHQEYLQRRGANLYSSTPIELPIPELYMIYTKERGNHPSTISLRDKFFNGQKCAIDATVNVIYLDDTDSILSQYIGFCMVYDEQKRRLGLTKEAAREIIRICIAKNLLREYLETRRTEVEDIMFTLFDQKYATEQYVKECVDKAVGQAVTEERERNFTEMVLNMLKAKAGLDLIMQVTSLPAEQIKKLAADNNLAVV